MRAFDLLLDSIRILMISIEQQKQRRRNLSCQTVWMCYKVRQRLMLLRVIFKNVWKYARSQYLVSQARSSAVYANCPECYRIRKQDALYTKSLPAYLTALYELRLKDKLYELAQELVTRLNDKAITWHAVGMYELYIGKYQEARKHFRQEWVRRIICFLGLTCM